MARFKMTREMLIPNDYQVIKSVEDHGVVVAADESGLRVIAFAGRAQKPAFHLRFRTVERASEYVSEWLAGIERRAAEKLAQREARKAAGHTFQVGDVLVSSWGYEQTNVDFYEVVALVGSCTVELREIGQERGESSHGMQGVCVPVPGSFISEPIRRRVVNGGVKVSSCQRASLADFQIVCGAKIYRPVGWSSYA